MVTEHSVVYFYNANVSFCSTLCVKPITIINTQADIIQFG